MNSIRRYPPWYTGQRIVGKSDMMWYWKISTKWILYNVM